MARVPQLPYVEPSGRHRRDTAPVITPEGRFIRVQPVEVSTHWKPHDATSINPEGMAPILPEMVYMPPA